MEIHQYVAAVSSFKQELIGLYEDQGVRLERKFQPWMLESTWGYRVLDEAGHKLTGSSIGDDEIRLFFDLSHLVRPSLSYVVGHAAGLSTFALALARPGSQVVAIDDWSEGSGGDRIRAISSRAMEHPRLKNVVLHSGRSPEQTPAAMERVSSGGGARIDLFFIDGLHTDEAALADFEGALPYLHDGSVVLWHNVFAVSAGFHTAAAATRDRYDTAQVLRTHGPLGVLYARDRHPRLHRYLQDQALVWSDWEKYRQIGKALKVLNRRPPDTSGLRGRLAVACRKLGGVIERPSPPPPQR